MIVPLTMFEQTHDENMKISPYPNVQSVEDSMENDSVFNRETFIASMDIMEIIYFYICLIN